MHISHLFTFTCQSQGYICQEKRNPFFFKKHSQERKPTTARTRTTTKKQKRMGITEKEENLKDFEGSIRAEPEREMCGFLEVKRVVAYK
jgi:hypothetical protein